MRKKNSSAHLIILLALFLIIQYAIVGVVGLNNREPWPAFVFPGFKSVYQFEDGYEIQQYWFQVNGLRGDSSFTDRLSPMQLFTALPPSQLSGFMDSHFGSEAHISSFTDETRTWLYHEAEKATGGKPIEMEVLSEKIYFRKAAQNVEPDSASLIFRVKILFEP